MPSKKKKQRKKQRKERKKCHTNQWFLHLNKTLASLMISPQVCCCDILIKTWWLSSHLTQFCLAPMIRVAVKCANQISGGLIEREAGKTWPFIHEFLFYITERNSDFSQTSKMTLFRKIVNSRMLFSLFEETSILVVCSSEFSFLSSQKSKVQKSVCKISLLYIINLHRVELNIF